MIFDYKIKLQNGELFTGTQEAESRFALARELRGKGHTPISIKKKSKINMDHINKLISFVNTGELVLLTKNMSGMLKAGLSVSRALSVLAKQTTNPKLKSVYVDLQAEINGGGSLSSGLAKFPKIFSKIFVSMTKAGEESGNLSGALEQVGMNLEKSQDLRKKIKGAMIYPSVIVVAMVLIGILMFAFVVPTLAQTFEDLEVELPTSTKVVISMGEFFSNNLILSFAMLAGLVLLVIYLFKAKFTKKYVDFLVLHLPIIGKLSKELNTARTARTLSSLLLAGVPIIRAIEITGDVVQNFYYKKIIVSAKEAIEKGEPLSATLEANSKLYPVMMAEMVQVGEETGNLSKMLQEIAIFYEKDIQDKTKNLATVIEPVLMVVVGAGVGFFAVSMISPLYSVLENIK